MSEIKSTLQRLNNGHGEWHRTRLHNVSNGVDRAIERVTPPAHPDIEVYPSWLTTAQCMDVKYPTHPDIDTLIKYMTDIVKQTNARGMAANQIGVLMRVFIIRDITDPQNHRLIACINPRIIKQDGTTQCIEGCLSLPGQQFKVKRAKRVKVEYTDGTGLKIQVKLSRAVGQIFQHELDHLDGTLLNVSGKRINK